MEYAILVIVGLAVLIYFLNGKEEKVVSKTTVSKPKSDVPTTAQLKKLTKTQLLTLQRRNRLRLRNLALKLK